MPATSSNVTSMSSWANELAAAAAEGHRRAGPAHPPDHEDEQHDQQAGHQQQRNVIEQRVGRLGDRVRSMLVLREQFGELLALRPGDRRGARRSFPSRRLARTGGSSFVVAAAGLNRCCDTLAATSVLPIWMSDRSESRTPCGCVLVRCRRCRCSLGSFRSSGLLASTSFSRSLQPIVGLTAAVEDRDHQQQQHAQARACTKPDCRPAAAVSCRQACRRRVAVFDLYP